MNGLADDAITIDTNVFLHMFNDRDNPGQHIDELLQRLMLDGVVLLVDKHGFINTEYDEKLEALKSADDTRNRIQLLRYWMAPETKRTVSVDRASQVFKVIKRIMREPDENVDRMFVGVAILADFVFVSNDDKHILTGREKRGRNWVSRRRRLLKETKKLCKRENCDILSSCEAAQQVSAGN